MKHIIKKISRILLVFMLLSMALCSFSSCSLIRREYKGKEIVSIEYISVDYMGGVEDKQKIDFTSGNVYESYIIPGQEDDSYDYKLDYSYDPALSPKIVNEFYRIGLFNLKDNYEPLSPVMDGGGWTLTITYADGTTKVSEGSNAGPYYKFKKADEAFFLLTGYEFLGYCDSEFTSPPSIDMHFIASSDSDAKNREYHDNSYISASNYTWNNKVVKSDRINHIPYFTFADNYGNASYYSVYLDFYCPLFKFKKIRVYSYTDNIEEKQTVKFKKSVEFMNGGWLHSVDFDVEANKNYLIVLESKYGTAEYYFSTVALPEEEKYKLISTIDITEYDKSTQNSINYRTIFTSGVVVKDKEGPDVPYYNRWDEAYYISYSYDNTLSDDVLDAFNNLGVFDFERYGSDYDEAALVEWEITFCYADGSKKAFKTQNAELYGLFEKMDEAFFEIVGQYIFKWGYIK